MIAVVLRCRDGGSYIYREAWHDSLTTITWVMVPTWEEAEQERLDLLAGDPMRKEIKGIWLEDRDRPTS